ncbi:MAG: hypothetical protein EOM55_00360 [Clostridia bacterium]|nr:hypothetical protein [Clostridia bacterium]
MKTNYPIEKLSWKGYDVLAKNVLKQVEMLSIDCVLLVLRGGTILGLTLANNLDVPSYYIKIRRSSSNEVNSDFSDPEMLGQIEIKK